jgi:hypothetical protein
MHAHCNRTQGGLDVSPGGMREQCLAAMIARDMPGYAIGIILYRSVTLYYITTGLR